MLIKYRIFKRDSLHYPSDNITESDYAREYPFMEY